MKLKEHDECDETVFDGDSYFTLRLFLNQKIEVSFLEGLIVHRLF